MSLIQPFAFFSNLYGVENGKFNWEFLFNIKPGMSFLAAEMGVEFGGGVGEAVGRARG